MAVPGDLVKVTTKDKVYEGRFLQRPDLLEGKYTVIKLSSGYNVGIVNSDITSLEVLQAHMPVTKESGAESVFQEGLPTVALLSFGGTISSKVDYRTGGTYADYTADDFVKMCPELATIANIKARKVMGIMSEDFTPADWKSMADAVAEEIRAGAAGVVITQGTDTLHFSAAALCTMFTSLPVPVVITAAQRSIDRGSSDAFMNLICAVKAATSDMAHVMTCLHGSINDDYCLLIDGSRVRKMHTSRRDAFRPINATPLGKVAVDGEVEILGDYTARGTHELAVDTSFEEKVALLYVYPGADPGVLDYYVGEGYKGVVIAATALGHVPTEDSSGSFIPAIKRAREAGLTIVVASQTLYGSVHPHVYSNLRKLSLSLGCVFLGDVLPEAAYIRLGCALGRGEALQSPEVRSLPNEFLN
ncbi:Glu-tRNA(Gln) amidotransferase subunit GatD [Candidatus Woesearchaeota archaeon]|nr:Glu-tRNA(Gln) amidotransferase subunit GatD [Candidatus Woesearchaeota archaeon]